MVLLYHQYTDKLSPRFCRGWQATSRGQPCQHAQGRGAHDAVSRRTDFIAGEVAVCLGKQLAQELRSMRV